MTDAADSSWHPPATRWPWRNFLTTEEKTTILKADTAKAVWLKLNQNRAAIMSMYDSAQEELPRGCVRVNPPWVSQCRSAIAKAAVPAHTSPVETPNG